MSLTRRKDGRWEYDFQLGGCRYRASTLTADMKTARKIEALEKQKAALGLSSPKKQKLWCFGDVAAEYVQDMEREKHGEHLARLRRAVEFWTATIGGDTPAQAVGRRLVIAGRDALVAKGLSASSVRHYLGFLRELFAVAVEKEQTDKNPARSQRRGDKLFPSPAPACDRVVMPDEEHLILSRCGSPLREYVTLLLMTGARAGEIANLRWKENVDFEERLIKLSASETKTRRARLVPLNSTACRVLKSLPTHGAPCRVFPVGLDRLGDLFKIAVESCGLDAGVRGINLRSLRHTVATRLNSAGVTSDTRSRLQGHSIPGVNSAVYTHPQIADLRRAVEVLEMRPDAPRGTAEVVPNSVQWEGAK